MVTPPLITSFMNFIVIEIHVLGIRMIREYIYIYIGKQRMYESTLNEKGLHPIYKGGIQKVPSKEKNASTRDHENLTFDN